MIIDRGHEKELETMSLRVLEFIVEDGALREGCTEVDISRWHGTHLIVANSAGRSYIIKTNMNETSILHMRA